MNKKRIAQYCCAALVASGIGLNIQNALSDYGISENSLSLIAVPGSGSGSSSNSNSNPYSNLDSNLDSSPDNTKDILRYTCVAYLTDEAETEYEFYANGDTPPEGAMRGELVFNEDSVEIGAMYQVHHWYAVGYEECEKYVYGKYKNIYCDLECRINIREKKE